MTSSRGEEASDPRSGRNHCSGVHPTRSGSACSTPSETMFRDPDRVCGAPRIRPGLGLGRLTHRAHVRDRRARHPALGTDRLARPGGSWNRRNASRKRAGSSRTPMTGLARRLCATPSPVWAITGPSRRRWNAVGDRGGARPGVGPRAGRSGRLPARPANFERARRRFRGPALRRDDDRGLPASLRPGVPRRWRRVRNTSCPAPTRSAASRSSASAERPVSRANPVENRP